MEQEMKKVGVEIGITLIPAEAIGPLPFINVMEPAGGLEDMHLTILFVPPVDGKETEKVCLALRLLCCCGFSTLLIGAVGAEVTTGRV